jgi:membrane protein DedA with SNARE-associated domain
VRLLLAVLIGRLVRFTVVGLLAIEFGHQILRLAKTDLFLGFMVVIIAIAIAGSVLSIRKWVRQSRKA